MNERDLTTQEKIETAKDRVQVAVFVKLTFDNGFVRAWSGYGDYTFNGEVFNGVGHLGSIGPIEETIGDIRASGLAMSLSGIPNEMLALCFEDCQSRPAQVWFTFFDEKWVLIPNGALLFSGRMDYTVIEEGPDTSTITLFAESRLIDLERARIRRYTDQDQRQLYPEDTGLRFIDSLQNKNVVWASGG